MGNCRNVYRHYNTSFTRGVIGNGLTKIKLGFLHSFLQRPLSHAHTPTLKYLCMWGGCSVVCRTPLAHKVRASSVYGCFSQFFFPLSVVELVCCLPGSLLYLVNTSTQLLTINGGSIPLRRLPLCALTDLATTYPGFFSFSFSFLRFLSPFLFFMALVSLKYMNLLKLETQR